MCAQQRALQSASRVDPGGRPRQALVQHAADGPPVGGARERPSQHQLWTHVLCRADTAPALPPSLRRRWQPAGGLRRRGVRCGSRGRARGMRAGSAAAAAWPAAEMLPLGNEKLAGWVCEGIENHSPFPMPSQCPMPCTKHVNTLMRNSPAVLMMLKRPDKLTAQHLVPILIEFEKI